MSETPILDLEQAPPEPPRPWLPKLIGVLLGLVLGLLFILEDQHRLPHWHWPGVNALVLIPALYAAIAMHELGHFFAGTLADVDTGGMAVGGFVLIKSGKHWSLRFDSRRWMAGGFFKPLTKDCTLPISRLTWMIAGGPLASIVLTAACALMWVHSGNGAWNWTGTLLWTALVTAIFSLVPFTSGLNRSDGAQLLLLLRNPHRACSWLALIGVQTEEANGLRPRDWDPQLFKEMLAVDATNPEYPYCQLMAFYRRLDEGGSEGAALQHLENALAGSARSGKLCRHILFLEAASASAEIRGRAAQGRKWCERACQLRKPESVEVVEAGIAMCERRYEEAARHWEAARAHVVRRRLDSGLIRFAKEKWAEHEAACRTCCQ